ncbi:MAG: GIY-YIG nuclease family protein [Alphaproteobacteria bacterium]|nr:GIY-YIG nuclease family protein [Alphaproteobacteria bacterium]
MGTHRTFIATYIMASQRNGTIYTGSTSNLESRVWKHKTRAFPGFTDENDCDQLVWFERHTWVTDAIKRERRLKKWMRDWKLALIEADNPEWRDLAADWFPENDPNWTPPPEED